MCGVFQRLADCHCRKLCSVKIFFRASGSPASGTGTRTCAGTATTTSAACVMAARSDISKRIAKSALRSVRIHRFAFFVRPDDK